MNVRIGILWWKYINIHIHILGGNLAHHLRLHAYLWLLETLRRKLILSNWILTHSRRYSYTRWILNRLFILFIWSHWALLNISKRLGLLVLKVLWATYTSSTFFWRVNLSFFMKKWGYARIYHILILISWFVSLRFIGRGFCLTFLLWFITIWVRRRRTTGATFSTFLRFSTLGSWLFFVIRRWYFLHLNIIRTHFIFQRIK